MVWLLLLVVVIIAFYLIKNKVVIHLPSFFKKGFKLSSNKFGCYCATGKQGSGKTLYVITFLYDLRKRIPNMRVITNVKSFSDRNKDFVIYNDNFYDIINKFKDGTYNNSYVIFYDEIFTLLEKGKLDKSILSFISQLRKRNLYLITTAQEWLEINVTFRRYVRYQIDCNMISLPLFNCALSINKINDGYQMQWDNLQNEYIAPRIKTSIRKCSLKVANSYDTFEVIDENNNISSLKHNKYARHYANNLRVRA